MTIGEYRKQVLEEIRKATEDGLFPEAQACLTLLQLIHDLDENTQTNFLTLSEIARAGRAATSLTEAEYEKGRLTDVERQAVFLRFFAHAEASKLRGKPINLEDIGASALIYRF